MTSSLRFLADESCDFAIVRALRAEGYDVLAASEVMPRSDDRDLIRLACFYQPRQVGRGHSDPFSRQCSADHVQISCSSHTRPGQ